MRSPEEISVLKVLCEVVDHEQPCLRGGGWHLQPPPSSCVDLPLSKSLSGVSLTVAEHLYECLHASLHRLVWGRWSWLRW